MHDIDKTILKDRLMPKVWRCPHCGKRNRAGECADEILKENFKYIQHCEKCGYLHIWYLELTEGFKRSVIELLKGN